MSDKIAGERPAPTICSAADVEAFNCYVRAVFARNLAIAQREWEIACQDSRLPTAYPLEVDKIYEGLW